MPFDSVDEHRETTTRECVTRERQSKLDDWDKPDQAKRTAWIANETHSRPINPYQRKKPGSQEIIVATYFRLTKEDGKCGMRTSTAKLILCSEYLWVSKALSIPLSSITEIGQSDRCGYIRYWNFISNTETELYFNSPQMFSARRKANGDFLAVVEDHLPEEEPAIDAGEPLRCEKCGSAECREYVFKTYVSFGFILIASISKVTPTRYILCAEHARNRAIRCSLKTALGGYFGIPEGLVAPCIVLKNLMELRREGACDSRTVILSILGGVVLPCALLAAGFLWIDGWLGSNGTVQS